MVIYNAYKIYQFGKVIKNKSSQFPLLTQSLFRSMLQIFVILCINWVFYTIWLLSLTITYTSIIPISSNATWIDSYIDCPHSSDTDGWSHNDWAWQWNCYSNFDASFYSNLNIAIIMDILYPTMAFHAYLFSIIGDECNVIMKGITKPDEEAASYLPSSMQHVHGASYILFMIKIDIFMNIPLAIIMCWEGNVFSSYSFYPFFIIIIIINMYAWGIINRLSKLFEKGVTDINIEGLSKSINIDKHNSINHPLLIDDNWANTRKQEEKTGKFVRIKSGISIGKNLWQKYKYWMNKLVILISCICTIYGASHVPFIGSYIIIGMASAALLATIISIIIEKCRFGMIYYIAIIIPYDNRYRFLCMTKTVMVICKQMLIMGLSQKTWATIYSVLCGISFCAVAYITYGIDRNFRELSMIINVFTNINLKRLYQTYLVSYIVTCVSTILILITGVLYFNVSQDGDGDENVDVFATLSVFGPFVWITFGKLYNNEFVRFKADIEILAKKEEKLKVIPSTPRSLFHFQNSVIITSMSTIVWFIYVKSMLDVDSNDAVLRKFECIFVIQLLFAGVVFVNGVFVLTAL